MRIPMSRRIAIIVAAAGVLVLSLLLLFRPAETPPPPQAGMPAHRTAPPAPQIDEQVEITRLPIADDIPPFNSPDATADDDLATIELLFSEFRKHQGGNPIGENDEITASLLGGNPKHLAYLPAKGPHLNATGQLIDRWGTPYFFHQLSSSETEIRSAGPDKEMYTPDDMVR